MESAGIVTWWATLKAQTVIKERAMYTNILIEAKATVLTVLPPFHIFTTDTQMIEDTPAQ